MSGEDSSIESLAVTENTLLGVFTRVGYRIFYAIVAIGVGMVIASFSLGAYLTDMRSEIKAVKRGQIVQTIELKEMRGELVATRIIMAREILPEAERRLIPLEEKSHEHK